jgi:sugar/nucleoside kinase (ribokinase family)
MTERTRELIDAVAIPIFAQHLLPVLTGEEDPERALRSLHRPHHQMSCVTLGASGAMLLNGDELIVEPAFHVKAVDTTGAGDVFRAALIYGLLNGQPPREMLRFANAAAAVSCTRAGALAGVPSRDEAERVLSGA